MDLHLYLEEQLKQDFELLKQLEEQLRYENDPRRRGKLSAEIRELKQQIHAREVELMSLTQGTL